LQTGAVSPPQRRHARQAAPTPRGAACFFNLPFLQDRTTPQNSRPAVLGLIGDTPLIKATRLDTGPCGLFLKLESQNPGGSIKDRIGLWMIEAAEREGRIDPAAKDQVNRSACGMTRPTARK